MNLPCQNIVSRQLAYVTVPAFPLSQLNLLMDCYSPFFFLKKTGNLLEG